jgi:hypothetical protein
MKEINVFQNFGLGSLKGRVVRSSKCMWESNVEVDLKVIR